MFLSKLEFVQMPFNLRSYLPMPEKAPGKRMISVDNLQLCTFAFIVQTILIHQSFTK
jgi:hypothetical protein